MIWHSFSDFWAMGGYAIYVWGSFGLTFALMALEMALARQRQRSVIAHVHAQQMAHMPQGDWHT